MTTRNFRVNNGLEVGDIVISANANTITGGATAAPNADGQFANKKYVDDSISAISTTSITTDSNATNMAVSGSGEIAVASGPYVSTKGTNQLTFSTDYKDDVENTGQLFAASTSGASTTVSAYRINLLAK